jgi:predicted transcriptional regulator
MSTTIHLPPNLLETVDHRARELGMSRNRYIIRALERILENETQWSNRFVEALEAARFDEDGRQAMEELRTQISANRTRKAPPAL